MAAIISAMINFLAFVTAFSPFSFYYITIISRFNFAFNRNYKIYRFTLDKQKNMTIIVLALGSVEC